MGGAGSIGVCQFFKATVTTVATDTVCVSPPLSVSVLKEYVVGGFAAAILNQKDGDLHHLFGFLVFRLLFFGLGNGCLVTDG